MEQLLIVDDDAGIREMLSDYLRGEGYGVDSVATGDDVVDRVTTGAYALVILDVMLPDINGLAVLRGIRARSPVPVLMLTARGEAVDRVVGLRLGADDYVPKPFLPQELAARIQAVLRRTRSGAVGAEALSTIACGDLVMDVRARTVVRDGVAVDLTAVEFDLLRALLEHAGQVVSRAALQQRVLGREPSALDRSVDTHVSNLRRKLGGTVRGIERIRSIRGTGYQYSHTPVQS
jgi:two-component system, OmpR family, response regulator CpxR